VEALLHGIPYHFRGSTGGHGWALAVTFFLQIGPSSCALNVRSCPRVPELMYPSRTRGLLPSSKTSNDLIGPDWQSGPKGRVRTPAHSSQT
jgi:hypothetical protein